MATKRHKKHKTILGKTIREKEFNQDDYVRTIGRRKRRGRRIIQSSF